MHITQHAPTQHAHAACTHLVSSNLADHREGLAGVISEQHAIRVRISENIIRVRISENIGMRSIIPIVEIED
jgi:hypothetical protein